MIVIVKMMMAGKRCKKYSHLVLWLWINVLKNKYKLAGAKKYNGDMER